MKIGLLQCDRIMEELRDDFLDYPGMFWTLFEDIKVKHEFKVFPAMESVLPESVDECDAYISTGSRRSINEKNEAFTKIIDFIQKLNEKKKKFVGICFGHQAMALALGGKIEKSANGWAVGVKSSTITKNKPWMKPFKTSLNIVVSHEEEVSHLPSSCQLLASNHHCTNHMFQHENHFLGIQGHPEFSKTYSERMMELRKDIIPASAIESARESLSMDVDSKLIAIWINNFLNDK